MKKKLLCVFFTLTMILSFAACGGDSQDTAADNSDQDFQAFMEVQKNMSDIKDMEYKMSLDMNIPDQETSGSVTMSGTGKEIIKSKDDIQMQMDYNMNSAGTEMKGSMYMKDQALYMDLMGQKVKVDTKNEMAAMMNVDTSSLLDITKEMVSDLNVAKNGNDTEYKFKLDVNKALSYFKKNVGGAGQLTDSQTEDVTFDRMDVTVIAGKDKMAKSITMDCSVTAKDEEQTVRMDYKISMEYISINTDLKIDFPDFSEYQELSV